MERAIRSGFWASAYLRVACLCIFTACASGSLFCQGVHFDMALRPALDAQQDKRPNLPWEHLPSSPAVTGTEDPGAACDFIGKWGARGARDSEFSYPADVAVDPLGNVFVADAGNHRVQKFDSHGNFLGKWGSKGSDDGQLLYPYGIAVGFPPGPQGEASTGGEGARPAPTFVIILVADTFNHRVQSFDSDGNFLGTWGSRGSGAGQFCYPNGVAVDLSGNVFVSDWCHRVQKFDFDGNFLTQWGAKGSATGQFWYPNDIAVDLSGNILVADTDNHRIQRFDSNGNFLGEWGKPGEGDGEFLYPNGVTVTCVAQQTASLLVCGLRQAEQTVAGEQGIGDIFVADTGNHRIQRFDSEGNFLAKQGVLGSGDCEFNCPFDVAVCVSSTPPSESIFVADTYNHRIQKLGYVFAIKEISGPAGRPEICWRSRAGQRYRLWVSADLFDWVAGPIFAGSESGLDCRADDGQHPLGLPSTAPRRFYRVEQLP